MKFSQRIGKTPVTKIIQTEDIDADLQNGLWNAVKLFFLDSLKTFRQYSSDSDTEFNIFAKLLWLNYYKLPLDIIPHTDHKVRMYIRERFYKFEWFEVYDFIEHLATIRHPHIPFNPNKYKDFCNKLFERENSAFRFINDNISPITNDAEINEIEEVIYKSGQFTALRGVNIHLNSALDKLSHRENPDYRNSIKESISAVESAAKKISSNDRDTLGAALDKIKGRTKIHPSLEQGFKKIYGYTSDSDGIRHALIDENSADFADAKFMLVSCSAFINYLIHKAEKAGISFEK